MVPRVTGYLHPRYAESLSFYGSPRYLTHSGGHIIVRPVEDTYDAIGTYPVLCCVDWSRLHLDLADQDDLVSLVAVTDPFGGYTDSDLSCFDFANPYKSHYIVDSDNVMISSHHQKAVDRAMSKVKIEVASNPSDWGDDWVSLYSSLIQHHGITGVAAFPPSSLKRQLDVPGAVALRAVCGDDPVSMSIWYVMGDVAYYHLNASSVKGYETEASYAVLWGAIAYFDGLKYLSLGAGAGAEESGKGLSWFKKGWSNGTRQTYLCGKVLDKDKYDELAKGRTGKFFPIYRQWT